MRNVWCQVPYKERTNLDSYLKQIFNSPTREMATTIAQLIAEEYQNIYLKVSHLLEEELESTLTYLSYLSTTGIRLELPI